MRGHRIGGKVLGIIGMGRIGQAVARRARAFGLSILYHNRRRLPQSVEEALEARFMPELDSLLQASDIITIHCPHNPETHELMDARRIGLLEPSAYFINTTRGVTVAEGALVEALEAQRIAGAGLDVYRHEPETESGRASCREKG